MLIEIVEVGKPYVKNNYGKLDITYRRDGGKESKKTLTAVGGTKDVIQVLKSANRGDQFEIKVDKDGEYYNWNGAEKVAAQASSEAKSSYVAGTKSTYETPEERATKNASIARQNALTNAVTFGIAGKLNPEEIVKVAQLFAEFNMGHITDTAMDAPKAAKKSRATKDADFEDDNPFGDPDAE